MYKVPTKIDGIKTKLDILHTIPGSSTLYLRQPRDLIRAKESLEILFAWGTDGQRQSLTWTMDGLSEAFAEACGEELDAEE